MYFTNFSDIYLLPNYAASVGIKPQIGKKQLRRMLCDANSWFPRQKVDVSYIIEPKKWAIRDEGLNISSGIHKLSSNTKMTITDKPFLAQSPLIHFGSQFMFQIWHEFMKKDSKIIVSYFHGKKEDGPIIENNLEFLFKTQDQVSKVIVSFEQMRGRLIDYGVSPSLITRIPVGVSTSLFSPVSGQVEREVIRERLMLPSKALLVGSFQKDGEGWGEGTRPKWIKGPDILISTLKEIHREIPLFVVLTGPSRGYVKNQLSKNGIPFKHYFPKNQSALVDLYRALDLYLITSREEGGPKGLIESLSVGCPVVTTPVGMAQDLQIENQPIVVTRTFEPSELAHSAIHILTKEKTEFDMESLRKLALPFDWSNVSKLHLEHVYSPLLNSARNNK